MSNILFNNIFGEFFTNYSSNLSNRDEYIISPDNLFSGTFNLAYFV